VNYDPLKPLSIAPPNGDFAAYVDGLVNAHSAPAAGLSGTPGATSLQQTPNTAGAAPGAEAILRWLRAFQRRDAAQAAAAPAAVVRTAGTIALLAALAWLGLGLVAGISFFADALPFAMLLLFVGLTLRRSRPARPHR
jgi:hypothetical protein